jgi:S1-C subfamily serine protease
MEEHGRAPEEITPAELDAIAHSAGETDGEDIVSASWQRFFHMTLGVFVVSGALFMMHFYAPPPTNDLQQKVQQLTKQVQQLQQEETMPAVVLDRYRNSICYIFGIYHVGFANQPPTVRVRVSGTGFLVASGLVATNRHVAEPWYGDTESEALIRRGAIPELEKLVAFFPNSPTPVNITPVAFAKDDDLAIVNFADSSATRNLRPLPLAKDDSKPGELVTVLGYPMGVLGMVAKSPTAIYDRLAYRRDDINAASELAALSLIRPSATCGHLGDVVGEKLIYDAPTAHGGSGGPVFDARGEVIGINSAYIDGFSGGTLGISVKALRPLLQAAEKQHLSN